MDNDDAVGLVETRVLERQELERFRLRGPEFVHIEAEVRVVELDDDVIVTRWVSGDELGFHEELVIRGRAVDLEIAGRVEVLEILAVVAQVDHGVDERLIEHRIGIDADAQEPEEAVVIEIVVKNGVGIVNPVVPEGQRLRDRRAATLRERGDGFGRRSHLGECAGIEPAVGAALFVYSLGRAEHAVSGIRGGPGLIRSGQGCAEHQCGAEHRSDWGPGHLESP